MRKIGVSKRSLLKCKIYIIVEFIIVIATKASKIIDYKIQKKTKEVLLSEKIIVLFWVYSIVSSECNRDMLMSMFITDRVYDLLKDSKWELHQFQEPAGVVTLNFSALLWTHMLNCSNAPAESSLAVNWTPANALPSRRCRPIM